MKFNYLAIMMETYIEEISGQSRIGYSMNDTMQMDFYDMIESTKKGTSRCSSIFRMEHRR